MTDEKERAYEEAEAAATSGTARMLEMVLERLGAHAGARAVFGEAVEKDGRTVIPVAQSIIGTGAGSGGSDASGSGEGAGGGAMTRPIGYIEMTAQRTVFVPLRQPWQDTRARAGLHDPGAGGASYGGSPDPRLIRGHAGRRGQSQPEGQRNRLADGACLQRACDGKAPGGGRDGARVRGCCADITIGRSRVWDRHSARRRR